MVSHDAKEREGGGSVVSVIMMLILTKIVWMSPLKLPLVIFSTIGKE